MNNEKIKIELTALEVAKLTKAISAAQQLFVEDFSRLSAIKYRLELNLRYQRRGATFDATANFVKSAADRGFHLGHLASCALLEDEAVGKARNAA